MVVDDGSADRTIEIVRDLGRGEPRIRVETLPQNMGPAAARNHGFAIARGNWIAVLDSDDLMAPDRLQSLIGTAERVGADIVSDNLMEFEGDDVGHAEPYLPDAKPRWISAADYLAEGCLFADGRDYGYLKPVFRADALRSAGLIYNEALRIAEDDDLIVRGLLAGLRYWNEPRETYFYRKHAASTSHRLSVPNAEAMLAASAELLSSHRQSPEFALLKRRHEAVARGLAFVHLIDALKRKRWIEAASIGVRHPAMLPLLRMPLGAAAKRLIFGLPAVRPPRKRVPAGSSLELRLDQ